MTCAGIFSFLDDTSDYIRALTFKPFENPIIGSGLKVGLKGMLIDIANVKEIYTRYVQTSARKLIQ